MTSRVARLWHAGDPRVRVFLPDFWMKLIETPKKGYKRLPKNAAAFEVDPRMSRLEIREYLEKIYNFPVRDVRTMNVTGEITWDFPLDIRKRKAIWKEEDKKIAYVFFKKDFIVEFPDTFAERKDDDEELRKVKDLYKGDVSRMNREYQNKDRAGAGEYLPL